MGRNVNHIAFSGSNLTVCLRSQVSEFEPLAEYGVNEPQKRAGAATAQLDPAEASSVIRSM